MSRSQHLSFAEEMDGHWMDASVLERLPNMGRQFDQARDPLIKLQLEDMDKTEAQRRGEGSQTQHQLSMPREWGGKNSTPDQNGTFLQGAQQQAMQNAVPNQQSVPAQSAPSHGPAPMPTPDFGGPTR